MNNLKPQYYLLSLLPDAQATLNNYQWPGNVRELQHTIEKAVIMGGNILDEYDFSFEKRIAQEVTAKTCTLEEMEKSAIENAMRECDGNMSLISVKLSITRQTLYNKIKKYNLI